MTSMRRVVGYALTLAILAGVGLSVWQHRAILDWWQLRGYSPPASIATLATDTAMTEEARRIFYVNHPELLAVQKEFREVCPLGEQTIVLGCYHSGQRGIYIYDVTTPELNGIEQVTAAHEMLHAGFERLTTNERQAVETMLSAYYQAGLADQRVRESIDHYRTTEPDNLVDEMHSIFGTEVATLPAALEQYYSRYFSDRTRVVAYSEDYEEEFTSRVAAVEQMDSRLAALKVRIDNTEKALSAQHSEIEQDKAEMEALRSAGNISAYNAAVAGYNAKVAAYNQALNRLEADIAEYNRLVEERNALAAEIRALNSAIDTRLEPQSRQ